MKCHRCRKTEGSFSTVLVMPSIERKDGSIVYEGLWISVSSNSPKIWENEMQNLVAQGFTAVQVCKACNNSLFGLE